MGRAQDGIFNPSYLLLFLMFSGGRAGWLARREQGVRRALMRRSARSAQAGFGAHLLRLEGLMLFTRAGAAVQH